jgi:cytochrome c biogenesis protein ResB
MDKPGGVHIVAVFRLLGSMRLGLILLAFLALTSAMSTLYPMERAIRDIYTSWWYLGTAGLLAVNLLACSSIRLVALLRRRGYPPPAPTLDEIAGWKLVRTLPHASPPEEALSRLLGAFRRAGLSARIVERDQYAMVFGRCGQSGRYGSLATHLGILILLAAAALGSITGFRTSAQGMAGDTFAIPEADLVVTIRSTKLDYLADRRVRPTARTEIVVSQDGRAIGHEVVSINRPARVGGVNIYHQTFLWVAHLVLRDPPTGEWTEPLRLLEGQSLPLDEQGLRLHFEAFLPDFFFTPAGEPVSLSYYPARPVLVGRLTRHGRMVGQGLLGMDRAETISTQGGEREIALAGFESGVAFQITRDIGRPYVLGGAILMLVGLFLSFCVHPLEVWAAHDPTGRTLVLGSRDSRHLGMVRQKLDRVIQEMKGGNQDHGAPT